MIAIVAVQTAMDAIIPNVSMAAHLTGAAIGFAVTMLMGGQFGRRLQEN
jgi:hypothetical protein